MSAWAWAAFGLGLALVPCTAVCLRGPPTVRLVGLEMTATATTCLLVAGAQAAHQTYLYDLALTLALLALGGGLVFARFLERWL